jgi:sigma-B regulation protein RsbU (phosphoserine phosphatase)
MSDSLLFYGPAEHKGIQFLKKMGYQIAVPDAADSPAGLLKNQLFDLVVIEGTFPHAVDLCEYLRADRGTQDIPIVYLGCSSKERALLGERSVKGVEFVEKESSPGILLSRIAMQLRLRKIGGADEMRASLAAMNATLRDLNSRFKKELEEARQIQESLLPKKLPADARYELAASYQPLEEVGGDWYFIDLTPSKKVSVQIADVTGHGLSAAFIGSMTKLAMAAADKEAPHELLCSMNRLMAKQIPDGRFVTMAAMLYDPASGRLQFSGAGHPPAIVVRRAQGCVQQLASSGFAVGFFEDTEYQLQEIQLEVGDTVLLITDGISEAQNMQSENYGFDRLGQALLNTDRDAGLGEVLRQLLEDFDAFRAHRILKDDVTLCALKRLG